MICDVFELCRNTPQCRYKNCNYCREGREVKDVSNITCSERQSSYTLRNPDHIAVTVLHVDGGLVRDEENCPKCDYLYDINAHAGSVAIFIELKGKHYTDALKQIENSVKLFKVVLRGSKLYARIIYTSVPSIRNNPEDIRLKTSLKRLGVSIKDGKKDMREYISSLL